MIKRASETSNIYYYYDAPNTVIARAKRNMNPFNWMDDSSEFWLTLELENDHLPSYMKFFLFAVPSFLCSIFLMLFTALFVLALVFAVLVMVVAFVMKYGLLISIIVLVSFYLAMIARAFFPKKRR